jgi:hypothetical protein
MVRLGEAGYHGEEEPGPGEEQEETDPASILRLPNGLNYRWDRWSHQGSDPSIQERRSDGPLP